jgi:hypothetical protein
LAAGTPSSPLASVWSRDALTVADCGLGNTVGDYPIAAGDVVSVLLLSFFEVVLYSGRHSRYCCEEVVKIAKMGGDHFSYAMKTSFRIAHFT